MSTRKILIIAGLLTVSLFAVMPEASARHHCRSRSAFGFSVNVGGPGYVAAPAPVVVAPPVYPVYPPPPGYYYPAYTTYPAYYPPVVVEQPRYYVQPGFSYSYWRR